MSVRTTAARRVRFDAARSLRSVPEFLTDEWLLSGTYSHVSDDTFEDMNGRFGHCWDPEGNRVQLWEPLPGM